MQDHLGKLQDAEVANKLLKDFLEDRPDETGARNSELITDYTRIRSAEHRQLLDSFPQAWAHFNRAEVRQALARAVSVL